MIWPPDVSFAVQIELTIVTLSLLLPCYSQFLGKYFVKYNIAEGVSIADPQWKTFFTEVCKR